MKYTLDEFLNCTNGYILYKGPNFNPKKEYSCSCNLDCHYENRSINPCDIIFTPTRMVINHILEDTINTVEYYINQGVRAVLFDEEYFSSHFDFIMNLIKKYSSQIEAILIVENNISAVIEMAKYIRANKMSKKTKYIAITGTCGKTTTTELLYSVLKEKYSIYRGAPEVNIRFRTAQKFSEVDADEQICLFECSGAVNGYLKLFSELIMPDYVIITKVGYHCLNKYRTIENVAKEKATLLSALKEDGVAILNQEFLLDASRPYNCKKVFIKDGDYELIKTDTKGSEFIYKNEKYYLPVVNTLHIDNAIKAIEVAKLFGLTNEEINKGFSKFVAPGTRWNSHKYENNVELIIDNPNNSHTSLIAVSEAFSNLYKNKHKRLILTKLEEFGNLDVGLYLSIAKHICTLELDEIICIGDEIKNLALYVEKNSNIKVTRFNKPKKLDGNDPMMKYLIQTANYEQVILYKGLNHDEEIYYANIKNVFDEYLKPESK